MSAPGEAFHDPGFGNTERGLDGNSNKMHKRIKALWVGVQLQLALALLSFGKFRDVPIFFNQAAVGVLGLLTLGLIAAVIALGAELDDKADSTGDRQSALLSTSTSAPNGFRSLGAIDSSSGTWVRKADFPGEASDGVSDGSAVAVDDLVYFMGGNVGGGRGNNVDNGVYIFDPLSDTFSTDVAKLPRAMARGAAAYDADSSTIYYAAGVTRVDGNQSLPFGSKNTPCLYALDTSKSSAKWQELACMQTVRSDFCAVFTGGMLYVLGGMDKNFRGIDTIEVYDPQSDKWSFAKFKLPQPRLDLACAVLDGDIWAVGGVNNDGDADWERPRADWFSAENTRINVKSGEVTAMRQLPQPRGDLGLARFGAQALLAVGGETAHASIDRSQIGSHDVWLYDVEGDIWVPKMPMPEARFRTAAVEVQSADDDVAVVVLGGHHRCERESNENANDDGKCDEIAFASMFLDTASQPLFVYMPDA